MSRTRPEALRAGLGRASALLPLLLSLLLGAAEGAAQSAEIPAEGADGEGGARRGLERSLFAELRRPYGECRGGYWSSNRNLDSERGSPKLSCWVHWRQPLGPKLRVAASARMGSADDGAADRVGGRFREAYVEGEWGDWTLSLGQQVLAWGRADRLNPTDRLSPRDFTLLVPTDEEQRMGLALARARYELSRSLSLTFALPFAGRADRVPQGLLPANTRGAERRDGGEWAVRLDRTGGSLDAAVSYYRGRERRPRYGAIPTASPPGFVIVESYDEIRVLGVDFAANVGAWALRGEAAQIRRRLDLPGLRHRARTAYWAVLGADRNWLTSLNVGFQVFFATDPHRRDRGPLAAAQPALAEGLDRLNLSFSEASWGLTLRIASRHWNDRLELELRSVLDLDRGSGRIQPLVRWSVSDAWKLSVGVDWTFGRSRSFFGVFEDNRAAYAELALVF